MTMIPENLRYSNNHEWAKPEHDGTMTVGVTFHAQAQLGDVVYVKPPAVGRTVMPGEACGVIESVKAASDIYSPLAGEVVAANPTLVDEPERVNREPYEAWIFRIKPAVPEEFAALLDAAAYRRLAENESR